MDIFSIFSQLPESHGAEQRTKLEQHRIALLAVVYGNIFLIDFFSFALLFMNIFIACNHLDH